MKNHPQRINVLSVGIEHLLGPLNVGLEGKHGTISVSTSAKGFAVRICGRVFARGRTLQELGKSMERARERLDQEAACSRARTERDAKR